MLLLYNLTQGHSQWKKSAGPKSICVFSQNTSPNNHNLFTTLKAEVVIYCIHFLFLLNHSLCAEMYNIGRDERRTHCWIPEEDISPQKSQVGLTRIGLSLPTLGSTLNPAPVHVFIKPPVAPLTVPWKQTKMDTVSSRLTLILQHWYGHGLLWSLLVKGTWQTHGLLGPFVNHK